MHAYEHGRIAENRLDNDTEQNLKKMWYGKITMAPCTLRTLLYGYNEKKKRQ